MKTAGFKCPVCEKTFTGHSTVDQTACEPKPGDTSICDKCTTFLVFEEDRLREMTQEEVADLDAETRGTLMRVRARIKEVREQLERAIEQERTDELDDEAKALRKIALMANYKLAQQYQLNPQRMGEVIGWQVVEFADVLKEKMPDKLPHFRSLIEDLLATTK